MRLNLGSFPEHFDQISSPGPLWGFLQAMGRATGSSEWEVQEEFSSLRAMQGVPEEFSVVYPKLVSRDALAGKGGRKERQTSSGNSSKALTTTGPSNAVTTIDSAAVEPGESLPPSGGDTNTSSADNDESADAVYESVTGSYYVYVLRDPVSREAAPFYVGKGLFDRANQHLRNAGRAKANRNAGDSENQDVEAMYGADAVSIWENESKQLRPGDESEKNKKITELVTAGRDKADIPRVVARTLSEEAALAVEAMLIESVYSQGVLTNIARGHHRQRFRPADDWTYLEGFDLPVDGDGSFKADAGKHKHGPFYVYVLRDPDSGKIFYVGKGKGNRLCQHFEMSANADRWAGVARLQRVAELLGKGRKPHEIGRVVARTNSEALAFVLESFYIKFVLGFGQLLNVQPGHMYGMFRSNGDWERRLGFDLPVEPGAMRKLLRDLFLGEGLDQELQEIVGASDVRNEILEATNPKVVGASEFAIFCTIRGVDPAVKLRIQIRCAKRVQLALDPDGSVHGRNWIKSKFQAIGRYPLTRADEIFTPIAWKGAANVAVDRETTLHRIDRLIRFARALEKGEREGIHGFKDLCDGLPQWPKM